MRTNIISVIIPVYNGTKYIKRILDCLNAQKYKNFEVIFVNDGSIDNSLKLLQQYKEVFPLQIRIVDQPNQGVSAARNSGLAAAEGEYVCFCDVDDCIAPDYLSAMYFNIYDKDGDVVICKSGKGEVISKNIKNSRGIAQVYATQDFLELYLYGKVISGVWTAMIRRAILKKNDIEFASGYHYSEDLHFMWRVFAYSHKIIFLDQILYFYEWNAGSAMSKFDSRRFDGYFLMKKLEPFFEVKNAKFYPQFKKYAAARIMWSIMRLGACKLAYKDYKSFFEKYNLKEEMSRLLTFPNIKVRLSALIYLIAPFLFYCMASYIGKNKVH